MRLGSLELLFILSIFLVCGGFKQLPKIAKAIGQSKKILKEEMKNDDNESESESENDQQLLADSVTAEDDKEL